MVKRVMGLLHQKCKKMKFMMELQHESSKEREVVLEPHHKDSHIHVSRWVVGCISGASESQNERGFTN